MKSGFKVTTAMLRLIPRIRVKAAVAELRDRSQLYKSARNFIIGIIITCGNPVVPSCRDILFASEA